MVYGLALISALGFALASVGQARASQRQEPHLNMSAMLLVRLFQNAEFLWSMGFDIVGVVGQFLALTLGAISIVQPVMSLGLVLAVVIEHRLAKRPLYRGDVIACVVTALALAVFVIFRGSGVSDHIDVKWSLFVSIVVIVISGAMLLAARAKLRFPSLVISGFAAFALGCGTVLEREVGLLLHHGVLGIFGHWQLWALVIIGPMTLLFVQSAFQLSEMKTVLPILTVGEPIFAVILGRLMVGEALYRGHYRVVGAVSIVVLVVSLLYLARSESRIRGVTLLSTLEESRSEDNADGQDADD